ncbi:heme-binding protein [Vibrio sp. HN007]|uniref:GlcG/HbpS family heme-binding protein n=1 Tax=Vibrio iocasae TaxID=3098914 RepID=UPI0035D405E0
MLITDTSIDWKLAHQIVLASAEYAESNQLKVCVSVLDKHGNPLAQLRINDAALPCTAISQDKAYTAVSFGFPTANWEHRLSAKPHLLSSLAHQPRIVTFGGGIPLFVNDEVVGAIGISGASEREDMACAEAGLKRFNDLVASVQR